MRRSAMVALAALLAGGMVAACGGDGDGAKEAKVTLTDYEIQAPASVGAGRVTFVTRNNGTFVHEIVLVKTDLAPDQFRATTRACSTSGGRACSSSTRSRTSTRARRRSSEWTSTPVRTCCCATSPRSPAICSHTSSTGCTRS